MVTKIKPGEGTTAIDTRAGLSASFIPEELLALARHEIGRGDLASALGKLKDLALRTDAPAGVFSVCGQLYLQLELWELAKAMFEKFLALHPGAPDQLYFLGSAHYSAGRGAEALKIWNELLQKFPTYVPALLYRAGLRVRQGSAFLQQ